ncbi:MAG: efflux RND transporter periplasmic adaptor subunit [Chitinophagales bacterium]
MSILMFLFSCGNEPEDEMKEDDISTEKAVPDEIILTQLQFKSAGIELGKMEYRNLSTSVKTMGRLSLPPQNKASVSAPFGGIVKEIKVSTGQLVSKGTLLALIENPDIIQLQQDYLENASHLGFTGADYERQKTLQKDNITSQKQFQQTEADYNAMVAKDHALKAKLQLLNINTEQLKNGKIISHLTITSPISGYVQKIMTNIGTFAEPNTMLFEIINNKDLHIDLQLFEKDVRKISIGQKVSFTFTNSVDEKQQYLATVFAIDKEFDIHTQAIIAHAKIQNPNGIMLPGMYVEARIIINNDSTLSIPDEAVVSQGDEHIIFIADHTHPQVPHDHNIDEGKEVKEELGDENTFRKIAVTVGASDMGFTAITLSEDVEDDARVVIKGAYALLSEMNKGTEEEE